MQKKMQQSARAAAQAVEQAELEHIEQDMERAVMKDRQQQLRTR